MEEGVAEPVCSSVRNSEVFLCQWRCSNGCFQAQDPICGDLLHRMVVTCPILQTRMRAFRFTSVCLLEMVNIRNGSKIMCFQVNKQQILTILMKDAKIE